MMTESALYNRNEEFWNNYSKGRPKFPPSLFDRFYDYHERNGGSFGTVNDVGAGIGMHSRQLARRFDTVVVTEPASQAISTARSLLSQENGRFRFCNAAGEEDTQPASSMDAVFVCNTLHWLDVPRFVQTAARQLKPGGTLFACLVAFPHFDDPAAQQTWLETMDSTIQPFMARVGEARVKTVLTAQDNACDIVDLPGELWQEGTTRLGLNCADDPLAFVQSPRATKHLKVPRVSHVKQQDRVELVEDGNWRFEMTLEEIEALATSFPFDPEPQVLSPLMDRFERLAEKNGGKLKGMWPVSILMASRR